MRKICLIALTCLLAVAVALAFADPALAATKKKKGGGQLSRPNGGQFNLKKEGKRF